MKLYVKMIRGLTILGVSVVVIGCGNRKSAKEIDSHNQAGKIETMMETQNQDRKTETIIETQNQFLLQETVTASAAEETVVTTSNTKTVQETIVATREVATIERVPETQIPTEIQTEKITETEISLKTFLVNNRFYSKNRYGSGWFVLDFKEDNRLVQGIHTKYVDYMEDMVLTYRVEGNNLIIKNPDSFAIGAFSTAFYEGTSYTYEFVPSENAFKAEISEVYLPTGEEKKYTAWIRTSMQENE